MIKQYLAKRKRIKVFNKKPLEERTYIAYKVLEDGVKRYRAAISYMDKNEREFTVSG